VAAPLAPAADVELLHNVRDVSGVSGD
jgi:hypothetical protein